MKSDSTVRWRSSPGPRSEGDGAAVRAASGRARRQVVVNGLGVGPDGRGTERPAAEAVVEEIVAAGGEAIADANSVATEDGAKAVVKTAMEAWGGSTSW